MEYIGIGVGVIMAVYAFFQLNIRVNDFILDRMINHRRDKVVDLVLFHRLGYLKGLLYATVTGLPLMVDVYLSCKAAAIFWWQRVDRHLNHHRWKRQNPYYRRHEAVATLLLCIKHRYPQVPKDIRRLLGTYIMYDLTMGWRDPNTGQNYTYSWSRDPYCWISWINGDEYRFAACRDCLGPMIVNVGEAICLNHSVNRQNYSYIWLSLKGNDKRYNFFEQH